MKVKVTLDATFILGQGMAKDMYNLMADGIKRLISALGKRLCHP